MKNEHAAAFVPEAVEYLTTERNKKRSDKYASVVCAEVAEALIDFCRQDAEFAQAVAQTKDFDGCLKAAVKGAQAVGGISDFKVYGQAAQFYFPGARIEFAMTIDLAGEAAADKPQKTKRLALSLSDIL